MSVSFAFRFVVVCALLLGSRSLPAAGLLESVADLRVLKPAEVATRLPVRLSGVVTYLRDTAEGVNFILEDGTGGVMVYPKQRPATLQPGQRIVIQGLSNQDIAAALQITHGTAKAHVARILEKLKVASRAEASTEALRRGLVHLEDG